MFKPLFLLFSLIGASTVFSQNQPPTGLHMMKMVVEGGDTIYEATLPKIVISTNRVFASEEDAKAYRRLVKNVRRVYPYAILINSKVKECNARLEAMPKGQRSAYMKQVEQEMKVELEKAFRANTVKQAQILIKLVDRDTGKNSYQLIKQFKGGWNAFMWQSLASLVGTNLKAGYDPEGEDKTIEYIIKQIEAE